MAVIQKAMRPASWADWREADIRPISQYGTWLQIGISLYGPPEGARKKFVRCRKRVRARIRINSTRYTFRRVRRW